MFRFGRLTDKLLSWCPLYRALAGGRRYWRHSQERRYRPAQFFRCGTDVSLGDHLFILHPERMILGDHVFIGPDCFLGATGGLRIGSYCALAARTVILTADHDFRDAESLPWGESHRVKPVDIADFVWIGMNASILPGVRIGEGAVVGLGTVVTDDVPPLAIVVGNPARVVGYRDKAHFERLKADGAIYPPTRRCPRLRIEAETRLKHEALLALLNLPLESDDATPDDHERT